MERLALYGGGRVGGRRGGRSGRASCAACESASRPSSRRRWRASRSTALLYDIEVDAMHAWLRNLVAFDAYCARRARLSGRGRRPACAIIRALRGVAQPGSAHRSGR